MNLLTALLDLLPPPYTTAPDSVIGQVLNAFALEMEALQEDVEAMRQSHWVEFAARRTDLEKLAALVGIERFPWEDARLFRARLLAFVTARLHGSLAKEDIKHFVVSYLRRTEDALCELRGKNTLRTVFVPGLSQCADPFKEQEKLPRFMPLDFVENPTRLRYSAELAAIGGRVPYLYRWEERNRGLKETMPEIYITGFQDGRTAVPLIVNLTTHDLIGYAGTVPAGQMLRIVRAGEAQPQVVAGPNNDSRFVAAPDDKPKPRFAAAFIDEQEVTDALFSVGKFNLGVPFAQSDLDERPLLPRIARGANRWAYLSVGLFDLRGLDNVFFAIADDELRAGVFNETFFDHAIFPTGAVARLDMRWEEVEPASFEVRVPWYMVIEQDDARPHEIVAEGLEVAVDHLHAAGVRAQVRFIPFTERQRQRSRLRLPWKTLEPEKGTAGRSDELSLGGHFDETGLGDSRFE
jgi:hypothetical protein